jgi:type IV pilus assembly protein PilY1
VPTDPDAAGFKGWYINLDGDGVPNSSLRAERVITDPLASTNGVVYFTTYKPYSDQCALGGQSFLWALKYNSGGSAGTLLVGKALIQVSTGAIEQLDLSNAFTAAGGRKSAGMEGVPPTAQGLSILTTPAPVKRVLHIRER